VNSKWLRWGLAAGLFALACGGSDPAADLERASRAVDEARSRVGSAREVVTARESEAREAKKRLAEAQTAFREAQSELSESEAAVDRNATDAVLFRTVQKRLLEEGDLANVAIAASVTNGTVTLSGSVPNGKLRDRAVEVARATPGVQNVQSRIEVPVAAGAKPAP
jgi:osmotically-inducible protein OsmY